MAKYRKGHRVYVSGGTLKKNTPAIVRDVRVTPDKGGKVKVTYIVETTDKDWKPKEKFKSVTRKQMKSAEERVQMKPKESRYPEHHVYRVDGDVCGHAVTVVGRVEITPEKKKRLSIGYAIQHTEDNDDPKMGAMVASRRCTKRPMSIYTSEMNHGFSEDIVKAICVAKAEYICGNINKFTKEED